MTRKINDGSFQSIFTGPLNKDHIKAGLKKGFLERSGTTNLLDQITETSKVVITNTATPGEYQITINNQKFDPAVRTNRTAFWFRRFIQFFTGKSERNEKINRVLAAVDNYLIEEKKQKKQEEIQTIRGEIARLTQLIQDQTTPINTLKQYKVDLENFHKQIKKNLLGPNWWNQTEKNTAANLESRRKLSKGYLENEDNRLSVLREVDKKISDLSAKLDGVQDAKRMMEANLEKLVPSAPPPPVIESLLAGSVAVNVNKASRTQKVDTSPLFSRKAFWSSVSAKDDFYQNIVCPSLKALSYLFTKDQQEANKLYTKWETELSRLGTLWKASGSENENIDDLFTNSDPFVANVLPLINQAINFISKLPINTTDFLKKMEKLDIPDEMDPIALPNDQVTTLLNRYLENPSTDLSGLFHQGSTMYRWPAECQFVVALSYLIQEQKLAEVISDSTRKQDMIDTLDQSLKASPPDFVTTLASAASSSTALSFALATAPSFIPKPTPYTETLKEALQYQTDDDAKIAVQQAIAFSETEKRKLFDDQYNAFVYGFMQDGITAVKSKHSNDEIDLPGLIKLGMGVDQKELMGKTKAYLENSDDPTAKKEAMKVAGKATMNGLKMLKVLSPTLLGNPDQDVIPKNPNAAAILTKLDQAVLPGLRKQPPIDLEKDSILPRLQTVLAPLNNLP